ncbi:MAG TPA: GFA family protein, partial [Rhizomicrobium sp.]|nr:GFA family protein [Rhizomicrobium sp.]
MSQTIEGGCRCGAVRYKVKADRLPNVYACHCRDCQTWSGSAFSLQFIVPEDALDVTGEPHLYERTSDDGERISRQRGCTKCITRVYNTNTRRPGMAVVRAGTLDRSDELAIVA